MKLKKILCVFSLTIVFFSVCAEANQGCSTISGFAKQASYLMSNGAEYNKDTSLIEDQRRKKFKSLALSCRGPLVKLLRAEVKSESERFQLLTATFILLSFYYDGSIAQAYESAVLSFSGSMNHRNILTQDLLNLYLQSEEFSRLNRASTDINLKVDDEIVSSAQRPFYTFKDESHLIRKGLNLEIGQSKIVIFIGHPLCHFSNDFLEWLNEKGKVFPRNIAFKKFARGRSISDLRVISNYNVNHKQPFDLILDASGWPQITTWETPSIYFIYKEEVVSQVVGSTEKSKNAFTKALSKLESL